MVNVVTFACDEYTDDVQAQLIRDLLILSGNWDVALWDPKNLVDQSLLDQLAIEKAGGSKISLCILYKTGDDWPEAPSDVGTTVERDLKPDDTSPGLRKDSVGFFLRPQGRGETNRTQHYLNRAYPKGKGIVNPLVQTMWG